MNKIKEYMIHAFQEDLYLISSIQILSLECLLTGKNSKKFFE